MFKLTINSQKEGQFWLEKQIQAEADAYIQWAYDSAHWGKPAYTEVIPAIPEIIKPAVFVAGVPAHDIVHPEYTETIPGQDAVIIKQGTILHEAVPEQTIVHPAWTENIAEKPAVLDVDGNVITPAVPSYELFHPEYTEVIPATPAVIADHDMIIVEAIPEQTIVHAAWTETIAAIPEINTPEEIIQVGVAEQIINHPAEYTIEVTDITTQVAYEKDIAKRVARINFGTQLFAELATRNVLRLKAGTTTLADLMSAEAKLAVVQRLMANSSTEIALQTLQAAIIPEIPQIEKDFFIAKIASYLAAE